MFDATQREIMSGREVTEEFGVPEGTLRYYRHAGMGPASFRLCGRVRYRRSDVLAWIAQEESTTRRGGVSANV